MSSVIDEDTARTIQTGRAAAGDMLVAARDQLRKVFIVFVVGLMGTIMALRLWIWDFLRENTKSRMASAVASNVDIITRTPFDVILVQVKIGLFVGIALALPMILYYSRDALRRRGIESVVPLSKAKVAGFGAVASLLFVMGVLYAYGLFFPLMFSFLAGNAISAGIKPSYDIVMYVQFLLLLTLSFGIAAQLPLVMSGLAYTEIVPYEFFRDKWRYAVMGIFVFGAVFSPPDPFTQVMWGVPLVMLYVFSLGLAKLVTNIRRGGETDSGAPTIRAGLLRLGVVFVAGTAGGAAFIYYDGFAYLNRAVIPEVPALVRPGPASLEATVGLAGPVGQALFVLSVGVVVVATALLAFMIRVLRQPVVPRGPEPISEGQSPADIDLGELDAGGVRAAPVEAFVELSEDEALGLAQAAMDDDDPEKARAILDRFDEAEEADLDDDGAEGQADADEGWTDPDPDADPDEEESNVFSSTAAGMANAFTEDETTEDDIGGYYYDLRFILESLTSKMFRLIGLFMLTIGASFYWLYQGGLRNLIRTFLGQLDPEVLATLNAPEAPREYALSPTGTTVPSNGGSYGIHPQRLADLSRVQVPDFVVALHPVEHIIFEIKVSVIIGVIVTLPLVLYYAWPALRERDLVSEGNRNAFLVWGGSLLVGVIGGSLFGFFFVAPTVITYLVQDALTAGMVISYRLNSFLWLVLYTTAGIGILAEIPVTMILFDYAGIVSYETMHRYWQEVIFAVFVGIAFFTPAGVMLLFLTAIPIAVAYGVGLAVLWMTTLPRRVRRDGMGGVFPS